jgi:hypothetical protein
LFIYRKKEEPPVEKPVALSVIYPDLKTLFVDTDVESTFNFYLPSSLVLVKKVRFV